MAQVLLDSVFNTCIAVQAHLNLHLKAWLLTSLDPYSLDICSCHSPDPFMAEGTNHIGEAPRPDDGLQQQRTVIKAIKSCKCIVALSKAMWLLVTRPS